MAEIKLTKPIKINGVEAKSLTMREPTVQDQLDVAALKDDPIAQELTIIANLCDVAPDDLKALTLKDYKGLQEAYVGFIE